jgi:hypothetical protein
MYKKRNIYLKNERLKWKTGPVGNWIIVEGGRVNGEHEKGGKCLGNLYTCMKIEQWNLFKLF